MTDCTTCKSYEKCKPYITTASYRTPNCKDWEINMRNPEQSYENPLDFERVDESQIRTNRLLSIDEILKLISEIWHNNPDLRLCQLIGNCFTKGDLYHIEDSELLYELIDKYLDS